MRRRLTMLGALAATASLALSANSFAQIPPVVILPGAIQAGHVEGKIADVEPTGITVTTIRLEDGTRLTMLASTVGPTSQPRPGDAVQVNYVETAGEKVVTSLRSEAEVQAP